MYQITTPTTVSAWTRQGEEPPGKNASASAIAEFIEDYFIPDATYSGNCSANKVYVNPPTRTMFRRYCEDAEYPWNSVAKELRCRQYARLGGTSGDRDGRTPSGIVIRTRAIEDLLYGLAPLCPVMRRGIGKKSLRSCKWTNDCGSWGCPECGVALADALIGDIANAISDLHEVYVGEGPYRQNQASMMWHRRDEAGAEMFWYRDVTGKITYLSDRPLPGRKAPTTWLATSPDAAIASMRETLWVPGHREHGWSEGWQPPEVPEKEPLEEYFNIMDLSESQVLRVMAIFAEEAAKDFDVNIATGHIPAKHQTALTEMMEDIINQVRGDNPDDRNSDG